MPYYARRHQLKGELVYHIWNRANRRLDIFHDREDHIIFKELLNRYSRDNETKIYHYCVMTNHYHLIVEIPEPEHVSSMMAGLQRLYTMHYHKRYKTSGYLWQGRFSLKPIQKDTYLQRCGAYIELNPVRAKMKQTAEGYEHSSARYYVLGEEDALVCEDPLYTQFGSTNKERRDRYKEFLIEVASEKNAMYNKADIPLGDNEFKRKLLKDKGRWTPRRKGKKPNSALKL